MNPTAHHFQVPEQAITRSNIKKIQVSNKKNNRVADIGKWLEDMSLVVELPIKTIYECLIFFNLYLISFISDLYWVVELYYVRVISWAYLKACNIQFWKKLWNTNKTFVFSWYLFCVILFQALL